MRVARESGGKVGGNYTGPRPTGGRKGGRSTKGASRKAQSGELRANSPMGSPGQRRLIRYMADARERHGVSRGTLAARIGVSPVTLWRWETGVSLPRRPSIEAWAKRVSRMIRGRG
jgi:DNA-binding XRE family transcriptional regulator